MCKKIEFYGVVAQALDVDPVEEINCYPYFKIKRCPCCGKGEMQFSKQK